MDENQICTIVLDKCFKIHKKLGPGLFESAYKTCLVYELLKHGLYVEREKGIPFIYEDVRIDIAFKADIIVERKVILEIKSVEILTDVHKKQLITYLKLTECKLGLLINFNESLLKKGINRIINDHDKLYSDRHNDNLRNEFSNPSNKNYLFLFTRVSEKIKKISIEYFKKVIYSVKNYKLYSTKIFSLCTLCSVVIAV